MGQRIGPISCVAFHPFQASLYTFSTECTLPPLTRIDFSLLSRSAPLLPVPSTALSPSMELRSGDTSIDLPFSATVVLRGRWCSCAVNFTFHREVIALRARAACTALLPQTCYGYTMVRMQGHASPQSLDKVGYRLRMLDEER